MLVLILIGLAGSLAQQQPLIQPYFLTELNQSVGVLFEEMSEMRTVNSEWEVLTYINLTILQIDQRDLLSKLKKLVHFCNNITTLYGPKYDQLLQKCGNTIDGYELIILEMEDFTSEYFSPTTKNKRGILNRMNNLKYFNHETTDLDTVYLKNFKTLESRGKYRLVDTNNKITYLQSIINIQTKEMRTISYHILQLRLQIESMEDYVGSIRLNTYHYGNQHFINRLQDVFTFTNTLIINFQYKLRQVLKFLPSENNGNNSPNVISPKLFLTELKNITNAVYHSGLELPNEPTEENLASLYEMTKIKAIILEEQLILRIAIPLVHSTPFKLYKTNPLPFEVIDNIYAYIFPETDYFIMDKSNNNYIPITHEELSMCLNTQNKYVCKITSPTIKESRSCIISMFREHSDLSNCEVRLTQLEDDLWIELSKPNTWIYVVPHTRVVVTKCQETQGKSIRLNTQVS